jgi:hypothetical protein
MTANSATLRGIVLGDYTLRGIMVSDFTTLRGIMLAD